MRKMKNSGIEWIGEIPVEWQIRKLKHYYEMQTGFTPDTKNEDFYDDVNGFDWVNISDIQDGLTIFETTKKISRYYVDLYHPQIIPKGSLLYSFKLSVGQTAFAGKPIYSNEAIASFLPNDNINLHYLRYSSMFIIENAQTNIYNAKILNQDLIRNAYIVYPPLNEQTKIASFLDQKCAEIDAVIEKTKATIEEYKKLKQSVITEAVTKGIRGNRPMKDSGIEWIGNICANYGLWRMKFLLREPLMYGANESGVPYEDALPRYIRITDITLDGKLKDTGKLSLTEEIAEPYILADNDVLFARSGGTVGKAFIYKKEYGKSAFAGYLIKASVNDTLDADYLFYYTQSSLYEEWKKQIFVQATIQNIGADRYNNLPIVLPPIGEQKEIVIYLDNKCAEIDALIAKKTTLLTELETYKKSLIYEYVTGKKEVGEISDNTTVAIVYPYFPITINAQSLFWARLVLMSGILDKNNYNIGRVKLEKTMHVVQNLIGFDLDNEYVRAEFGPLDNSLFQCEGKLNKEAWIKVIKKNEKVYYKPGKKKNEYQKYYGRYFADCDAEIDRIIDILKKYDTKQSEIIATLFAAWNDAIIDKKQFTDEDIVNDVLTNWHESKRKIPKDVWLRAMDEMRKNNLVPKGYGKKTVIKNDTM